MLHRDAAEEFNACMDDVLARIADERTKIILQIMAASIGADHLNRLQRGASAASDGAALRKAFQPDRLVKQLAAVCRQIVALDLDRAEPLRILGVGWSTMTALFGARSLGHEVVIACHSHEINDWMLDLYRVPRFDPRASAELPEGPFDLIISSGSLTLGTKKGWAEFVRPLADKLHDKGRIFIALNRRPYPNKNYYPGAVIAILARLGARVSSKNLFVLLDKEMISELARERSVIEVADENLDADAVYVSEIEDGEARPISADIKQGSSERSAERPFSHLKIRVILLFGIILAIAFWLAIRTSR
jgi:hypothetical protein